MTIADWLTELKLEQYVGVFEENGIDMDVLPTLSATDLTDAGVKAVGHRRKMLNAIAQIQTQSANQRQTGSSKSEQTTVAERRQLTILSCDIVGSTAIVANLDPEESKEVISGFFYALEQIAKAESGHVGHYLGDGALVYFGYPHALENNAESATRAALSVVQAVEPMVWPDGTQLRIRVGISTGTVIVGDAIGSGDSASINVIGETANLAQRLQSAARPAEILIDDRSHRLLGDLMEVERRDNTDLQGLTEKSAVWTVHGANAARSRFAALRAGRMTGFVGRTNSLQRLKDVCSTARNNKGLVATVAGEAGIGKSRLVHELTAYAGRQDMDVISWFCSPGEAMSAYAPVIAHTKLLVAGDTDRIRDILLPDDDVSEETVALFERLLSLPASTDAVESYSPPRLRRRTIDVIVEQLLMRAAIRPLLLVVEDYHWIDPSTRELLDILCDAAPQHPILILITHRPGIEEPRSNEPDVERIWLRRIDHDTCRSIIEEITGDAQVSEQRIEGIIEKADGIPLFVEELARSTVEMMSDTRANGTGRDMSVPDTLQDALMARVDKLESLRDVIQTAALIGRSFDRDLLSSVVRHDPELISKTLQSMVDADIIVATDKIGQGFRFQHALLQDVLAASLLRDHRTKLHNMIAKTLLVEQSDRGHPPDRIAYHFVKADEPVRAMGLYIAAGQDALQRFANIEAVAHLDRAKDLAVKCLDPQAKAEAELAINTLRGLALMMIHGWAAPEVGEAYQRAHELWETVGSDADKFPIAMGMMSYSIVRGNFDDAMNVGAEALEIATSAGNEELILAAEHEIGATLVYRGAFLQAIPRLERCVTLYQPGQHDGHMAFCGKHQAVAGWVHLGMADAALGKPSESAAKVARGIALADQLNHPFSQSFARLIRCSNLRTALRPDALLDVVDETLEFGRRQEYPHVIAQSMLLKGWALSMRGQIDSALTLISAGLDMWRGMGARLGLPQYTAILAETLCLAGEHAKALETVDQAIAEMEATDERMLEPEAFRTKGDILKAMSADPQITAAQFIAALDSARQLGTPLFALRAMTRLSGSIDAEEVSRQIDLCRKFAPDWILQEAEAALATSLQS